MDLIKEIHQYLQQEIDAMNAQIIDNLNVEEELISVISKHLANSGGKRIRPILTILSSKLLGYEGAEHIKLATAIEFIHMATLLHDDVIDGSKMRRFLPTANTIWGSKASILVGDFLFSQAFRLIVATKSLESLEVLSKASAIIAEGEVTQLVRLEEHRMLSEQEYLKIIAAKTAELFASSCEVGGIIANATSKQRDSLRNFGYDLGSIFQISDDLLDYFGNLDDAGKNVADDFLEGKVTLPLILLSRKMNESEQKMLLGLISKKIRLLSEFDKISELLQKYNIKQETISYLKAMQPKILQYLEIFPAENDCKNYLIQMVDFAISRTY